MSVTLPAVEKALKVYESLLEIPNVERAALTGEASERTLHLWYNQVSVASATKAAAQKSFRLSPAVPNDTLPPTLLNSDVKYVSYSSSGQAAAHFIALDKPGSTRRCIEAWRAGVKHVVPVTHGTWHTDLTFGPPTWNASGDKLLYVAEDHDPDPDEYTYVPDFGESYRDARRPCIFCLDLTTGTITRLVTGGKEKGITFVQPQWVEDDESAIKIVATGWTRPGNDAQLGVAYCTNRPSAIYLLLIEGEAVQVTRISAEGRSARTPRISPSAQVIYLSNAEGGPHDSCAQLHSHDLQTGEDRTIVPTQREVRSDGFAGLYLHWLPEQPFTTMGGSEWLACPSISGCRKVSLLISLSSGEVIDAGRFVDGSVAGSGTESYEVLAASTDGSVVLSVSSPSTPWQIIQVDLSGTVPVQRAVVTRGIADARANEALAGIDFAIQPMSAIGPGRMILISPCPISQLAGKQPPIVVYPHGGPHGSDSTSFNAALATFALAGFLVVLPAYPGSTGFGQDYIESLLPPALGTAEVDGTLASLDGLREMGIRISPERTLLVGSSHGGFIGAHAAGRYPGVIAGMVLINPTINYLPMIHSTDIPDIISSSSGVPYPYSDPPHSFTPEEYSILYRCSPMANAHKARTPTLLLLGADDGRVSPEQGKMWYHALKMNGVEAELLIFPKNRHVLIGTVEAQLVSVQRTIQFCVSHVDTPQS